MNERSEGATGVEAIAIIIYFERGHFPPFGLFQKTTKLVHLHRQKVAYCSKAGQPNSSF